MGPHVRSRRWRSLGGMLLLAFALTGCLGGGGGANGQVGQCGKDATGNDDITIVDCSSADAKYKIVGVEEDRASTTGSLACAKYKEATKNLWYGKSGSLGRVLCLQELTK